MQLQIRQTRSRQRQMGTRDRHPIAIPHSMEAAAIDHFGPAEALTLHVLPVPSCDADEVLIALDTAGVAEVYELVDAAKAHRRLAERGILGKIILRTHRS
jgi:NADPH:quinone reductase-like Zn-dependent oxidoreductase